MFCRWVHWFIYLFIFGMHHSECIAPDVDMSLQSGRFWATSIVSFRERLLDFRSCWIVFIHVLRWRPVGLLQSPRGQLLRSSWHLFHLALLVGSELCVVVVWRHSLCGCQDWQNDWLLWMCENRTSLQWMRMESLQRSFRSRLHTVESVFKTC